MKRSDQPCQPVPRALPFLFLGSAWLVAPWG